MKRIFNCTETELYALCISGWATCVRYIKEMFKFSPMYTEDYVASQKEKVLSTMESSDSNQRVAKRSIVRSDLNEIAKKAIKLWRSLKLYIEQASEARVVAANLKEIGIDLFANARRQQWDDLFKMLKAGLKYIELHKSELMQNQNMPESFEADYLDGFNRFYEEYNHYLSFGIEGKRSTSEHVETLNSLFNELNKMFEVGRLVFADNPSIAKQFRVSHGLASIKGTGWAGIKGKVYDENGKLRVIEGLELQLLETDDLVIQEDDGSYVLNHLASGQYTLALNAPGYKEEVREVTVKIDTYTTLDFNLKRSGSNDPEMEETA